MEIPEKLSIVPIEEMPKPQMILDAPTDDTVALFILARKMQALCQEEDGIGLSAVQVGIPWRMFVLNLPQDVLVFLNCSYRPVGEDKVQSLEGCSSIPRNGDGERLQFVVDRYAKIEIVGQKLVWDQNIEVVPYPERQFSGFAGVVLQHEIGHQMGELISNIGKPFHIQKVFSK